MPAHRCFCSVVSLATLFWAVLLVTSAAYASAPPDLVSPQVFPAGGGVIKIAVGDFNHDGKLDAVVINSTSSFQGISVLLGNGDGTFQLPVSYPIQSPPITLAVADFNNDGFLDVAVGTTGGVSIYVNRGDGTFLSPYNVSGEVVGSITAADFNGDHNQDLVLASGTSEFVFVLLGNGDGTFQPALASRAGGCALALTSGDFNHDGKLDLAISNTAHCQGQDQVSILLGHGDGSFAAPIEANAGPRVYGDIVVADFNHDGNLDVAIENNQPQGYWYVGNVEVFLGNGDGTLQHRKPYLVDFSPMCLVSADFNGDGNPDLLACSQNGDLSFLYGKGNGAFQRAVDYQAGPSSGLGGIAIGDFNGDGLPDILTPSVDNVSLLLGQKGGGYNTAVAYQTGPSADQATFGDFTGDGIPDLVVSHSGFTFSEVTVSPGIGNGRFLPQIGTIVPANGGDAPILMALGDFNRDGKLDIAISQPTLTGPTVTMMLGNGDGTFTLGASYSLGMNRYYTGPIIAGDLNGDGFLDLIANCGGYSSMKLCVFLGNGDGTFAAPTEYAPAGRNYLYEFNLALADLNHDGILDLVVTYYIPSSTGDIAVMLGKGDGAFAAPIFYSDNNTDVGAVAIADLNGDGNPDIAVAELLTGTVRVQLGNGDGTFGVPTSFPVGSIFASGLAVADFNHDGKLDVAVGNGDIANTFGILHGNGDGTFQAAVNYSGSQLSFAVGDLTGKGGPDLVVLGGDAVVYLNSQD
jgi:hypothetical protein